MDGLPRRWGVESGSGTASSVAIVSLARWSDRGAYLIWVEVSELFCLVDTLLVALRVGFHRDRDEGTEHIGERSVICRSSFFDPVSLFIGDAKDERLSGGIVSPTFLRLYIHKARIALCIDIADVLHSALLLGDLVLLGMDIAFSSQRCDQG